MRQTTLAKNEEVTQEWVHVDATDQILGRLSTEIAMVLMGKTKPTYTPHVDTGDHIVVVNASRIRVTGNKMKDKTYYRHTGYVGNLKSTNLADLLEKHPEQALQLESQLESVQASLAGKDEALLKELGEERERARQLQGLMAEAEAEVAQLQKAVEVAKASVKPKLNSKTGKPINDEHGNPVYTRNDQALLKENSY